MITHHHTCPSSLASDVAREGDLPLQASIRRLNDHLDKAPVGWRRHLVSLIDDLQAVEAPKRQHIDIGVDVLKAGTLRLSSPAADSVVQGLLRKAMARMSCTCMVCGRSGKPRQVGLKYSVLCAPCVTPRRLRQEFWELSDSFRKWNESNRSAVGEGEIPPLIRHIIPNRAWQSILVPTARKTSTAPARYLTMQQCTDLLESLAVLQDSIEVMLENSVV